MKLKKFYQRISGFLFVLGLLMALGTAGSSDLEIISRGREALQLAASLALIAASLPGIFGGLKSDDQ